MQAYDDLIAKYILSAALSPDGVAQAEREIPMLAPQATDLYFEPAPGPRSNLRPLRWLRYMTPIPCLLELYSQSLTLMEFLRGPLRKDLTHFHSRCLEAERKDEPPPYLHAQWLLTAQRPQQLLEELCGVPLAGAPVGFYRLAVPVLRLYLVVLSELPRERDTLVLRLLGGPTLRRQALAELRLISEDDPEREVLLSLLSHVQAIMDRDPRVPRTEKEEFMLNVKEEIERFRTELVADAVAKARAESKAESVINNFLARGVAVDEAARRRIMACKDLALLDHWHARAIFAASTDELFRPEG